MKTNQEEFLVGAIVGTAFFSVFQWWTLAIAPVCGLLWMMGGQYNTMVRRVGVPLVLSIASAVACHNIYVLGCFIPAHVVCRLGYGIPDATDKGSAIGRWVHYHITGEIEVLSEVVTRAMIGALLAASFWPLAIISLHGYVIVCVLLVLGMSLMVVAVE